MNRRRPLSALLLLLILTGCTTQLKDSRPQAWLQPGVRITLPAPGITPEITQQQLLTATVSGKQHSLLVLLQADQQQLSLVGLSALGIRLFTLIYDHQGLHTEQVMLLPELPPASQVLADIMLSYWPITAWQPQLPAGWTLRDHGDRRELRDHHGTLVTVISYRERTGLRQPIALRQHRLGYQIAIQPLDN